MFNRTYIQHGPSRVEVNEHRAPTDESVRLLREMEETARKSVIETYRVEGNHLEGVRLLTTVGGMGKCQEIILFQLNGQDFTIKGDFRDIARLQTGIYAASAEVFKALADAVAYELLSKLAPELLPAARGTT